MIEGDCIFPTWYALSRVHFNKTSNNVFCNLHNKVIKQMDSFIRKKIPFFLNNWNLPNFLRNSSLRHKTACASHLAYSTFRTEISNFWLLLSWLFRWCFSNEFYMIIFHILLMTTDQALANDGSLYPMHIQLCVTMYVCLFVYLFLWYSLVQHLNRSTKCDIRVLIALSIVTCCGKWNTTGMLRSLIIFICIFSTCSIM